MSTLPQIHGHRRELFPVKDTRAVGRKEKKMQELGSEALCILRHYLLFTAPNGVVVGRVACTESARCRTVTLSMLVHINALLSLLFMDPRILVYLLL
jgi:hypothetical protein